MSESSLLEYINKYEPLKKYITTKDVINNISLSLDCSNFTIIIKEDGLHTNLKIINKPFLLDNITRNNIDSVFLSLKKLRKKYLKKAYAKFERKIINLVDENPLCYNVYYEFKIKTKILCNKENIKKYYVENKNTINKETTYIHKISSVLNSLYIDYTKNLNLIE